MTVTSAKGFCGERNRWGLKASGKPDVALVVNNGPKPRRCWCVFTSNRIKAAPVLWSPAGTASGELKAVASNSGGANACTGPDGFADTTRPPSG